MNVGAKYFAVGPVLTLPFRFSTALSGFASSFCIVDSAFVSILYLCLALEAEPGKAGRLSGEKQGSYSEDAKADILRKSKC